MKGKNRTGQTIDGWLILGRAGWAANGYRAWYAQRVATSEQSIVTVEGRKVARVQPKHFLTEDKFGVWSSMRQMWRRVKDPKHLDFPNYGGRPEEKGGPVQLQPELDRDYWRAQGMSVRDATMNVLNILFEKLGPRLIGTTLDRIDPWLHYSVGNLRWADKQLQARNKRRNVQREAIKEKYGDLVRFDDDMKRAA
jgi:hypothetical protein